MQTNKIWKDGELVEVEGNVDDILQVPYNLRRLKKYNLHFQLECLYNDIQAGLFGEAAKTGDFCRYVDSVKQAYPKS